MAETISAIVQFKRMTRAQWSTSQYVPKEGEMVCESDTGFVKVGDGTHRFADLKYLTGPQGVPGPPGQQGPPGRDGVVTFESLSQAQINSLKGDRGEPGQAGERGHSLTANVRIEGNYRNGVNSQLNVIADVYYDGTRLTSGYTVDFYYRGFGNNNWTSQLNQRPDANGKIAQWSSAQRSGGYLEVYIVVTYQGIKAAASTRLDNVQDGARGEPGQPGPKGADGKDGEVNFNLLNGTKEFTRDLFGAPENWQRDLIWNVEPEKYKEFTVMSTIYNNNGLWQNVAVTEGRTYEYGFYAKAEVAHDDATVGVSWGASTAKRPIVDGSPSGFKVQLTTDWKFYSFRFTAEKDGWTQTRLEQPSGRRGKKLYICGIYLKEVKNNKTEPLGWSPSLDDLQGPVYRIAKVDIQGGVGATATIQKSDLMNPDGVKVGDIIQDFYSSAYGADEGWWSVTNINNDTISVTCIGVRTLYRPYNDSDIKRRITALENRPAPTGFVNQKTGQPMNYWMGSKVEFDAISNKDANTVYDYYE